MIDYFCIFFIMHAIPEKACPLAVCFIILDMR